MYEHDDEDYIGINDFILHHSDINNTDPSNLYEGCISYDNNSNTYYYYDGSTWNAMGDKGHIIDPLKIKAIDNILKEL